MSEHSAGDDPQSQPRHRGPGGSRDGILILDDGAKPLSAPQRKRLDALRAQAIRSGDVVIVAAEPADPNAELAVGLSGSDVFTGNPDLTKNLRKLGVKRLTVVGSNPEKLAATCHAGRRAGFTVDLASLNSTPHHEYLDEGDVDLSDAEPTDHADQDARSDKPATPAKLTSDPENHLLPGAPQGSPPVGADSPDTFDDGRTDAIHWDDTWALRGEKSPADKASGERESGVKGWISRKLHEARDNQTKRPRAY